jgi:hypothetical protein
MFMGIVPYVASVNAAARASISVNASVFILLVLKYLSDEFFNISLVLPVGNELIRLGYDLIRVTTVGLNPLSTSLSKSLLSRYNCVSLIYSRDRVDITNSVVSVG